MVGTPLLPEILGQPPLERKRQFSIDIRS